LLSPLKSPVATPQGTSPTPYDDVLNETEEEGTVIGKYTTLDVPPPGAGLTTVTAAVWKLAMSEERIVAFICDPLTNVVARALPFQCTREPGTKPVPFTISVNPDPAGLAASGKRGWLIKGTGF